MKPGYKTTEFWLSSLATVIGILAASGVIVEGSQLNQIVGLAASVLASLGYSISRGMAKGGGQ